MSDWKNNPAISAIIAGSVVLTTTLLVTFSYVLPVYQQADKNTIYELKNGLEGQKKIASDYKSQTSTLIAEYEAQTKKLKADSALLKDEIDSYKDYLLKLSFAAAFQRKNPLPIGYAKIFPGMKLSQVYESYDKVKITPGRDGGYLKIKPNVSGLGSIIYYAGDDENPNLITHIFVSKYEALIPHDSEEKQLQSSINKLSLFDFLNENLGAAEVCGKNGNLWHLNNEPYYIYFSADDSASYSIWFNGNSKPGIGKDCQEKIIKFQLTSQG